MKMETNLGKLTSYVHAFWVCTLIYHLPCAPPSMQMGLDPPLSVAPLRPVQAFMFGVYTVCIAMFTCGKSKLWKWRLCEDYAYSRIF